MADPEQLRLEADRAYVVASETCKLACRFCFVDAPGYSSAASISTEEAAGLRYPGGGQAQEINAIYPTHDTEIFTVQGWADMLRKKAELGKHILFATKAPLDFGIPPKGDKRLTVLQEVDRTLQATGRRLHPSVSISRFDGAASREIEPLVPSPQKRAAAAGMLYEAGLPVSVSIRPTLPFVPDEEYAGLVAATAERTHYYLTSPLYLTPDMRGYMDKRYPDYHVAPMTPGFMGGLMVDSVDTSETVAVITDLAAEYDRPVFSRSAQAVEYVMQHWATPD